MKLRLLTVLLLMGVSSSHADNTSPYAVVERGPHHRVWSRVTAKTFPDGEILYSTNSYTELALGMHFWNGSQWVDSSDQIQITQAGAAATNGPHQVLFSANILGSVDLALPSGQHMISHLNGLSYFDTSTSNNVIIAEMQDSIGQLLPSGNQVIYTNATRGFDSDVRYTYSLSGLEQDIILRQQVPPPQAFGLNPETTLLQIWTEFTQAPVPQVDSPTELSQMGLWDANLDFGTMEMVKGKAFSIGEQDVLVPVAKHWNTTDGRTFLIEEVPISTLAASLQSLPPPPPPSSGGGSGSGSGTNGASLSIPHSGAMAGQVFDHLVLPARKGAWQGSATMRLAQSDASVNGLVLDYNIINGTMSNLTFQSDTTYYISNNVTLLRTNSIEGGTVVKYAAGKSITFNNVLNVKTGPYRPAIFTAKDDDTVGDPISGSTGTPSGYYANNALSISATNNPILQYLRINYASYGIFFSPGPSPVVLSDLQFGNCNNGIFDSGGPTVNLRNCLFHDVVNAMLGQANTFNAENITVAQCGTVVTDWDTQTTTLNLTNSLLVNCTNLTSFGVLNTNAVATNNSGGVFQTVGAGKYYLATNSTYRGKGTTNINSLTLADIRTKTTYPPIVVSGSVTNNTTLSPQATRDNTNASSADLGYHYDPLDYIVDGYNFANATLTMTNGVAVACYNSSSSGIGLDTGATLISTGTPLAPNWFTRYLSVQETPTNIGGGGPADPNIIDSIHNGTLGGNAMFRFSKFTSSAGGGLHFVTSHSAGLTNLLLQDCELYSVGSDVSGDTHAHTTVIKNSLFQRSAVTAVNVVAGSFSFNNNTFIGARFWENGVGDSTWSATNNVFDSASFTSSVAITNAYNAYFNCGSSSLTPTNGTDIFSTNSLAWQTGPLGDFYQPTNSVLIDQGSTNASLLGLYHYTTQTSQVRETNSPVDIGYHYVALSNGIPFDINENGTSDYLENPYGAAPPFTLLVAWGENDDGQCNIPAGLSNVVQAAGGFDFSVALKADGTVLSWGDNTYGQTNTPALSNAVAISCGPYHSLALKADGTVSVWGSWYWGTGTFASATVPGSLSNVVAIAAGQDHDVALHIDGTVTAWGYTNEVYDAVPTNLPAFTALAAGWEHNAGLGSNGTVTVWGANVFAQTNIPAGLSNVTALAAGADHTMALIGNGLVIAWGATNAFFTNADQGQTNVPATLSNAIAIAAAGYHSLALVNDGTIADWGETTVGMPSFYSSIQGNVIGIGAGVNHDFAICWGRLAPVIVQQPASQVQLSGSNVTFSAQADGSSVETYQWQFNGTNLSGQTNATLTLTNVSSAQNGNYQVLVTDNSGTITSSNASFTMLQPPQVTPIPALGTNWFNSNTNLSVSATDGAPLQFPISYQWQFNGTNIALGTQTSYSLLINASPSATLEGDYSLVASNAAGTTTAGNWHVRYDLPGMVAGWGANDHNQLERPATLTNTLGIAAGLSHGLAVRDDGTVIAWGNNANGQKNVPGTATNVIAVAAGDAHSLALRADGTVVAWGSNGSGQTNVPVNVTNAIAIAAGGAQSLALLQNGIVVQWGLTNGALPAGLTNVSAIAAGTNFCLALSNSTVVAWGAITNVPASLSNNVVVAIAAGGAQALALLQTNGGVVAWGASTNAMGLTNVMAIAAGYAHNVALKNDSTVVAWGDNTYGQTNVITGLANVKAIAAGGNFTLAAMFSPLIQYPVTISNDLLLIYNTNSVDSSFVMNYYLTNRPMVSNANVLGIGVTNSMFYETVTPIDFANLILAPVTNWLAGNPTKRPQYVILFLDVPSRVEICATNTNNYPFYCIGPGYISSPSVSHQLATGVFGWQPFVTHINMNGTNDCIGYIDKLKSFGSNSPNKLFISASASTNGYGNTNYYFDDVNQGFSGVSNGWGGAQAVLQNGAPSSSVHYTNVVTDSGLANHITNGNNIAGYFSWGFHSTLHAFYATNGTITWSGNSSWYVMETSESFNGQRINTTPDGTSGGHFIWWFASNAFGGSNYSATPVGAISTVAEPGAAPSADEVGIYFGLWQAGNNFAICAWAWDANATPFFQAVGDPFVKK